MVPVASEEPEILILLPHGEQFGPERAGAIALHVRDVTRASRFKDRIRIFGTAVARPFEGFDFHPLQPAWHGLRGRNIGLAEQLLRWVRGRRDVLVEVYNRPNMFAHLAARAPDLPLTLRLSNDPRTMRGARTAPERARMLARAQAIFCVSDFVRQRFLEGLERHGQESDRQKLQVTFNGIPRTLAAPPEKEPLILFVGRIIAAKGVADLVAALERVLPRHPGWQAEIVGTSRTRRKREPTDFEIALRERSARLGGQVRWPGYLPNEEVMARYRRAAIVVVPSLWDEPLARTAIEGLGQRLRRARLCEGRPARGPARPRPADRAAGTRGARPGARAGDLGRRRCVPGCKARRGTTIRSASRRWRRGSMRCVSGSWPA